MIKLGTVQGEACGDYWTHACCCCCAVLQEWHELRYQAEQGETRYHSSSYNNWISHQCCAIYAIVVINVSAERVFIMCITSVYFCFLCTTLVILGALFNHLGSGTVYKMQITNSVHCFQHVNRLQKKDNKSTQLLGFYLCVCVWVGQSVHWNLQQSKRWRTTNFLSRGLKLIRHLCNLFTIIISFPSNLPILQQKPSNWAGMQNHTIQVVGAGHISPLTVHLVV